MQILNYKLSPHPGHQNTVLSGFHNLIYYLYIYFMCICVVVEITFSYQISSNLVQKFMSAIAETSSLAKLFKNMYAYFGGSVLRGLMLSFTKLFIVSVIITL